MVHIEKDDEHTRARILRGLPPRFDAVRLASQILGQVALDQHPLELLDLLRRAALDDLEILLTEVGHRRAVLVGGIDVDADVVRLGAERRLCRRLRRRRGLLADRLRHGCGGRPKRFAKVEARHDVRGNEQRSGCP